MEPLTSTEVVGQRPTWAEIDLDALAGNYRVLRELVGSAVQVMSVVKANAYGHGAVACARRLRREGAGWFGVALPEEAVELRHAGIDGAVLCLGGFWANQAETCIKHRIVPVIYRLDTAETFDRAARAASVVADVHLKIDTGMNRLGVRYTEVHEFADRLRNLLNIRVDGVMTHFAAADDPQRDEFTQMQAARYQAALAALRERGFNPTYQDLGNSAATFAYPSTRGNLVRPGGALYGLWRDVLQPASAELATRLRHVLSFRTAITLLKLVPRGETIGYGNTFEVKRDSLIATLPVGYNDGYVRALSNCGQVIVRGRRAPVVGRVSMDLTLVDVTDVPGVALDDRVTLIGTDGNAHISAEEIAKAAGTLSYEITCGISRRVPHHYLSADKAKTSTSPH